MNEFIWLAIGLLWIVFVFGGLAAPFIEDTTADD